MVGGLGAQNIFYSAKGNPVELTDNADLEFAAKNKVSLAIKLFIPERILVDTFYCSPLFTSPKAASSA
jgi:hypothetical protein